MQMLPDRQLGAAVERKTSNLFSLLNEARRRVGLWLLTLVRVAEFAAQQGKYQ